MRPAPGMHVEWVEGEAVILDTANGHLHYLNPSAALVYALILEHGYDAGIEAAKRTVDDPRVDEDLPGLIAEMRGEGLLVDD